MKDLPEAYLEPCETSKMGHFAKNAPSEMSDKVLIMLLVTLLFAMKEIILPLLSTVSFEFEFFFSFIACSQPHSGKYKRLPNGDDEGKEG